MSRKRGRPLESCTYEYLMFGHKILSLSETNPTLSMSALARHYEVSEPFVAKVLSHPDMYRSEPAEPVPMFLGEHI